MAFLYSNWSVLEAAKDVRKYGAVGDGSTDNAAFLQAAVDDAATPHTSARRGELIFPPGNFVINSPVTWDGAISIGFKGLPGARISGDFADALLKRAVDSPLAGVFEIEGLQLYNSHASGKAVMMHSCLAVSMRNCEVNAWRGIETYNSQCATIDTCSFIAPAASATSVGIMAGNATTVLNTDVSSYNHGIRHQNVGLVVTGGRYEVNGVGIMLGQDENGGTLGSSSVKISAPSMETNATGIHCQALAAASISCKIGGNDTIDYGIRIIDANGVDFHGVICSCSGTFDNAGISIEGASDVTFNACLADSWNIATGLTSFDMRQCNVELTVAQLPTSARVGTILPVSDATATTEGTTVSGGGSNHVAVVRTASSWRII